MLAMGGRRHHRPSGRNCTSYQFALSYEYDPCDFLKAKEMQQKRLGNIQKSQTDDLTNINRYLRLQGTRTLPDWTCINEELELRGLPKRKFSLRFLHWLTNISIATTDSYPGNYRLRPAEWHRNICREVYSGRKRSALKLTCKRSWTWFSLRTRTKTSCASESWPCTPIRLSITWRPSHNEKFSVILYSLLCIPLRACKEDEYVYPNVITTFIDAATDENGTLQNWLQTKERA